MQWAKLSIFAVAFLLTGILAAGEIHEAVQAGNTDQVKLLLKQSPDLLESQSENGSTPLLEASATDNLDLVKFLVDAGADIKAVNRRGSTPLHIATYEGKTAVAKYLLTLDVDINSTNRGGFTPLMFSVYNGYPEIAKMLLDKGADKSVTDPQWGGSAIHWASNHGNRAVLELLVKNGFTVDQESPTDSSTPIFWAANSGNIEAIEFLVENDVDVSKPTAQGWTPLHNAAQSGRVDVAQFMIEKGADIYAVDERGNTPFSIAVARDHLDLAKFYLDNGIDVNQKDEDDMTPLHWAAFRGNLEFVNVLIDKGAEVDILDRWGTTPLTRAINHGYSELAQLFISKGADINVQKDNGNSLIMEALIEGSTEMVKMLLDAGAVVNKRENHYGRTELHMASIKGFGDITQLLVAGGADVNAEDNNGKTPLWYACKYGNEGVAGILKKHKGKAKKAIENFGISKQLSETFADGETATWYLGHCGFAMKTKEHLMIFDYWSGEGAPDYPCLANGHINPEELKDQNVYVFVTHEHGDHYDTAIYDWANQLENITYIYGFRPEDARIHADSGYHGPTYEYMAPRTEKTIDGMKITTIEANDAGVGFYIEVDGVKLYHAGDHAGWREGQRDQYLAEIDFLAEKTSDIDFAFINVTGCHVSDTVALAESVDYALGKLNPKCWFPTHGHDREYDYIPFTEKEAIKKHPSKAICAENRGDCFVIRNAKAL